MSYACRRCGATSQDPHDERNRYCGRCHQFEEIADAIEAFGKGVDDVTAEFAETFDMIDKVVDAVTEQEIEDSLRRVLADAGMTLPEDEDISHAKVTQDPVGSVAGPVVIQVVGIPGRTTSFDGQYLTEYDPDRAGVDPVTGEPMFAYMRTTPDKAQALRFDGWAAAHAMWTKLAGPPGHTRPDGQPDRPLTAFTISIEPAEGGPCNCGHDFDEHAPGGACRGRDSYDIACACPSFEPWSD